nr:uncharacterized protein LOC124810923 [Hydra vulgaris]XP_047131883.1 uncharacterized protein LOC124810923 [Hydra vulgaris]
MNCSYFYNDEKIYIRVQNSAILIMVIVGILFNLLTIVATLRNSFACHCSTARLFLSCYAGNVCGLISLALNGTYNHNKGIPTISCQHAIDYNFFFYLGFTVNMAILVYSTYNRYKGVLNNNQNVARIESNKKLLFLYALPSWLFSLVISSLFTVLNFFEVVHFNAYFVCGLIGIFPILTCITLNILLKYFLSKMIKNAQITKKTDSLKNITVAISMLQLTTVFHSAYLVAGFIVLFFLKKNAKNQIAYVILDWVSRTLYYLMFTIEAKAFFIKYTSARKDFGRFLKLIYKKNNKFSSVISKESQITFTS